MDDKENDDSIVNNKHWDWVVGMEDVDGWRIYETWSTWSAASLTAGKTEEVDIVHSETGEIRHGINVNDLGHPEIHDEATQGCIQNTLLPEAWKGLEISLRMKFGDDGSILEHCLSVGDEWSSGWILGNDIGCALIACLRAAP